MRRLLSLSARLTLSACAVAVLAGAPTLASSAPFDLAVDAQPTSAVGQVTVQIGGDLSEKVEKLGDRDVQRQIDDLTRTIGRALEQDAAGDRRWAGARFNLVVTDLAPNRPTIQQAMDRPGLSIIDSISIGGATIEGEVVTSDGQRLPVRYSRYSNSIHDVFGYDTWADADRAFEGFASGIKRGNLTGGRGR